MINQKRLEKIEKLLGKEFVYGFEGATKEELETSIVNANSSMKQAKDELEENENYQNLKESLKHLSAALKDVNKRQNAIVQLSLHLLEEKGQK